MNKNTEMINLRVLVLHATQTARTTSRLLRQAVHRTLQMLQTMFYIANSHQLTYLTI